MTSLEEFRSRFRIVAARSMSFLSYQVLDPADGLQKSYANCPDETRSVSNLCNAPGDAHFDGSSVPITPSSNRGSGKMISGTVLEKMEILGASVMLMITQPDTSFLSDVRLWEGMAETDGIR
ncbi:hypothetical protein [Sphingomonas sp. PWP1-2]|uniref:hypothetical protein n=1 Tax=Sphingomonas sp. PWP1-2 TaxID=2804558 RepID=UPI003CED9B88